MEDLTPEEILDEVLYERKLQSAKCRRYIRRLRKIVLSCGEFIQREEDGSISSPDQKANEWLSVYNVFHFAAQKDPVHAYDKLYHSTIIKLYDPTIAKYAGIPNFCGMTLHITTGVKRPDEPWIDKFKAKFLTLDVDQIVTQPKVTFAECVRVAKKHEQEPDRYNKGWVAVGKYLIEHHNEDKCKIVKRGEVIDRKNGDQYTIYHVITPDRLFIITASIPGRERNGNDRKLEIFTNTVWGASKFTIEQEQKAMEKLRGMLTEDQYRQYIVTGQFEEYRASSNVSYFLRRLRPTIACSRPNSLLGYPLQLPIDERPYQFLAGLCLHPLSYSMSSFAGSQCPTDDIVTHLLWIRGDEHRYWSKANHHTMDQVECGMA